MRVLSSFSEVGTLPGMTRSTILPLCAGILTCCLGCVPPLPLNKRFKTPTTFQDIHPDFHSIRTGVTTREQVNSQFQSLAIVDTSARFWGRFLQSSWSDPGGSRAWGRNNLMVAYDDHGVVRKVRFVSDYHMARTLVEWLAADPALRPPAGSVALESKGMILHSWTNHLSYAELSADGLRVRDADVTPPLNVVVPFARVRSVSTDSPYDMDPNLMLNVTVEGLDKPQRTVQVELSPKAVLAWLDFLRAHCPNAKYR